MVSSSSHPDCYFAAAGAAAVVNFPLWRASAIAQSGFKIEGPTALHRYAKAVFQPPYRGISATVLGMTWARAAIFYGSDSGRELLQRWGFNEVICRVAPALVLSTTVQLVNQPLVRSSITIQNPTSQLTSVREALVHIYKTRGPSGLWHGVSAGIMKTVPKYVTAVFVKDFMEAWLPKVEKDDRNGNLLRSATKSVAAGVAGAGLTNPLDVLRNEMFKTDLGVSPCMRKLWAEEGWRFMIRGFTANMTAVAIPITITIFTTDLFVSLKTGTYQS